MMMMNKWWIISFFIIKLNEIHCNDDQCTYTIEKSDKSIENCVGNECSKFVDLLSIMVQPKTCKTSLLSFSFSSYKKFVIFRDNLGWKLSDLFVSESIYKNRSLTLYLNELDYNDQPFDRNELVHLGISIDYYILYIKIIQNKNYLSKSIHYDPNNPQWNILKLKFKCPQLIAFDEYACSNDIISPTIFHPQRPLIKFHSTTIIMNISNHSTSTQISIQQPVQFNKNFNNLYLIIILLSIILFIIIIVSIYIIRKIFCKTNTKTISQSSSSSITTSNPSLNVQRVSPSLSVFNKRSISENRLNVHQVQSLTKCDDYPIDQMTQSENNLDDTYEKVTLDNISIIGEQYFVPISSSLRF